MTAPLKDVRLNVNEDSGDTSNFMLLGDPTSKSMRVNLWVWDTGTTAWVRMVQPSMNVDADDLTITMGDVEKLLSRNYWKDKRLEYSAGDLIYKGFNTSHGAATDAATWYIWKHTWSAGDLTRIEGPLIGTWDGRADLAWS